jgi:hypothetical protein
MWPFIHHSYSIELKKGRLSIMAKPAVVIHGDILFAQGPALGKAVFGGGGDGEGGTVGDSGVVFDCCEVSEDGEEGDGGECGGSGEVGQSFEGGEGDEGGEVGVLGSGDVFGDGGRGARKKKVRAAQLLEAQPGCTEVRGGICTHPHNA